MKSILPINLIENSRLKNFLIVLGLSILFYLPYILHTFYSSDTMAYGNNSNPTPFIHTLNPLPDMLYTLKTEYKPLYGIFMQYYLPYKIGVPSQILILMGVIFFSIAIYGFVDFFVDSLNQTYKLVIYLLAFANPYIFMESGWWGQFMGQGLVSCLYLISFILIDRYKNNPISFKKIALAYGVPIFSVVFGLNFFMPSFFHFIVLAFLYVLKNHLENPFKTVKDFFYFSMPLFIIIGLGAIIYTVEIKGLFAMLNIEINKNGRARSSEVLSSFSELKTRFIIVITKYPMFYNVLSLVCASVLFFGIKKSRLNIIFVVLTPIIILFSYGFKIILNMNSSSILSFPNYYLFVFLFAFVLVYLKDSKLKTMLKRASLVLIVFFYCCSYFLAVRGLQHEKIMKTELAKLEQLAYRKFKKGTPIFIIGGINSWDNKLMKFPFLVSFLFSAQGYNLTSSLSWAFKGRYYGFKNITGKETNGVPGLLRKYAAILRQNGLAYPNTESIFLYNGTIYVVGDR